MEHKIILAVAWRRVFQILRCLIGLAGVIFAFPLVVCVALVGLIGVVPSVIILRISGKRWHRAQMARIDAQKQKLRRSNEIRELSRQLPSFQERMDMMSQAYALTLEAIEDSKSDKVIEGPPDPALMKPAAVWNVCFGLIASILAWIERFFELPFRIVRYKLKRIGAAPLFYLRATRNRRPSRPGGPARGL